jgi:hypothetical protein
MAQSLGDLLKQALNTYHPILSMPTEAIITYYDDRFETHTMAETNDDWHDYGFVSVTRVQLPKE